MQKKFIEEYRIKDIVTKNEDDDRIIVPGSGVEFKGSFI